MRPELFVFSRAEFNTFVLKDHANCVAIRIINPNGASHLEGTRFKDEIRLEFWDVEEEIENRRPIDALQAKAIVDFFEKNKYEERFVFHCEAGERRSYTCALFYADKILRDDILVGLLASNTNRSINFAVWNALCDANQRELS